MKELKSPDKVVQQMTRDGAVEVNKSTGGAESISARDADTSPTTAAIGGVVNRVQTERQAAKKRTQRKTNKKIYDRYQSKPETTRLQFTDAERASPTMSKAIKKSDKAADRYEKARARVPQKPKSKSQAQRRVSDKPQGKNETRLVFKEREMPRGGRLTHALERPTSEAANFARGEVRKYERDNTGLQAAGFSERSARSAARTAGNIHSRLKFEPQRRLLRTEKKAIKANVNALYKRDLRAKPGLAKAGALKKAAYKRRLKRNYAKAFRQGTKGTKAIVGAVKKVALVKAVVIKALIITKLVIKKAILTAKALKILLVIGGLLFFIMMFVSCFSSCMSMFGGGFNQIIATSYTAEDEDILGANEDYIALQNQLTARINNIQNEFPGFDEYRFNIAPITHDPFALASYLTTLYLMYTREQVQITLAFILSQQYTLTITPITEVRTRTETRIGSWVDIDGNVHFYTYTVQVQYNWYVLVTTLVNRGIEAVATNNFTPEQLDMFHVLMETRGNRPELFP